MHEYNTKQCIGVKCLFTSDTLSGFYHIYAHFEDAKITNDRKVMMAILASSSIQTYRVRFKDIGEPLCLEPIENAAREILYAASQFFKDS